MKLTTLSRKRKKAEKKEHEHDEKIRESSALMVRLAVATKSLAAQQDPNERTVAKNNETKARKPAYCERFHRTQNPWPPVLFVTVLLRR